MCRPTGPVIGSHKGDRQEPVDIGLGGACIYSDDPPKVGTPLELELFHPDGTSIICRALVVWTDVLPKGGPAVAEVGLQFTDLSEVDLEALGKILSSVP
jgi:hypothetical protein